MTHLRSFAAAYFLWCFTAATLLAQANPLEVIPDDALGLAVIKDLGDTNERDDKTVVSAYGKEQLVHAVKHVRSGGEGLAADADLAKTSALLPAGAQWVAYVSPQGLVQWIGVLVEGLLGGQMQLPPFPASEPIGLAAKVSESGLDAELVLPDTVVGGIGQYILVVGQMFQNGGLPLP